MVDMKNESPDKPNVLTIVKSDWKILISILSFGIIIHILRWIGWPHHNGGDGLTYIYYYLDTFNQTPTYHNLLCFRLPVAPFIFGPLLSFGGNILTSVVLELLSLSAIFMIYLTTKTYGKWTAIVSTVIFILMFGYQIQYHQVTSDGIFAWFIILFLFLYHYSLYSYSLKLWILLGVSTAGATLTRPNGLALILVIFIIPFLRFNWKKALTIIMVIMSSIKELNMIIFL